MESWVQDYWVEIAAVLSSAALLGILKRIGFTPVVKLWSLAGRCIGWVWGWASSAVFKLAPIRKNRSLLIHKTKMDWLHEQIRRHEALIHENRYLALENRRDSYVRVCRELTSDIHVDSEHEPKLIVWIRDQDEPEYVWLMPSGEKGNNRWATHPDLSRRLSELFEAGSDSVWLSVVLPSQVAGLEIKPRHVSYVPYADNTHRAILTLDQGSLYSVVDEMNATIHLLGGIGWPAAALAKKDRLIPSADFFPDD